MSRLKVAVIGVGALGRHHARILSGLPDVELVGVADPHAEQARKVAEAAGCDWSVDYHDLLDRVDAVSIAVPTFAHREVGVECLEAGKATLIEKPLAARFDDAETLVSVSEQHKLTLAVGHVERFNPAYQEVKRRAGRVRYVRAERLSPFAFRSTDIGVVHDLMIHDLDLVLDLVGSRPARVEAFGVSLLGSHEDSATARVTFENGAIADLTVNRVNPFARRTLQTFGEAGCVTADLTTRQVTHIAPSAALRAGDSPLRRAAQPGAEIERLKAEMFGVDFSIDQPDVSPEDALTAELTDFVTCCRTGAKPRVGGNDALAALAAAERVLASIARHEWEGRRGGLTGPMAWTALVSRRKAA